MSVILLQNRCVIKMSGPDAFTFLQGLITQDIQLLQSQSCLFAAILNAKGRFLFDIFIIKAENNLYIDVSYEKAERILKFFKVYKLRSHVDFELDQTIKVYSILNESVHNDASGVFVEDPRHQRLGFRFYGNYEGEEGDFSLYEKLRISLSIPDGDKDIPFEKGFILEFNFDKLNSVSFNKGCYLGQELISNMHHRNLAKRTLITLGFENEKPIPEEDVFTSENIIIGKTLSCIDNMALALVLKDEVGNLNGLFVGESQKEAHLVSL